MGKRKVCAIMQPTYLPWLGYFDLMDQVDIFIFLDNVQFAKRSWQQRNRVKTSKGLEWLTVPVFVHGRYHQLIKDVEISEVDFWKKHLRTIELNYRRAPYFDDFFAGLLSIFESGRPWRYLVDLNIELIKWLTKAIGIKTPLLRASTLEVTGKKASLLVAICQKIGATKYISPIGSASYLLDEIQQFVDRNIEVFFHNYTHPTYNQLFPPFLPFASVIDLIFNEGPKSLEIIQSGRRLPSSPEEVCERVQKEVKS